VGKVVNIASRCAGFITRHFAGRLAGSLHQSTLWDTFTAAGDGIAERYEKGDTARAVREIMALADQANQYIAEHAPWQAIKEPGREADVQAVCSQGINLFRVLMVYLKPILPQLASDAEAFLDVEPLTWKDLQAPLLDHDIRPFKALFQRLEKDAVDQMVEASRQTEVGERSRKAGRSHNDADRGSTMDSDDEAVHVSIDDFSKIALRVARIVRAAPVDGADKLLRLTLDVGELGERQVFAGIKQAYAADALADRLVVVVANLAPRKMRFGVSEGMVLAAGPGDTDIFLLSPDSGAQPGMIVR
jgi:methionyl-tRNA synthetase